MDCAEVEGQIPAEQQLEPLVIFEEGDELKDFTHISISRKNILRVKKEDMEEDKMTGTLEGKRKSENQEDERESMNIASHHEGVEYNKRQIEDERQETQEKSPGPAMEKAAVKMEGLKKDEKPNEESPSDTQDVVKLRTRDRLSPEDAQEKVHSFSLDSPEALYELLCVLQEGRRINDQRCSFTLQPRRRCHSEPGTPRHTQKVVFSSMTSLQKEEFFDLVATFQARRLDDQRADFQSFTPEAPVRSAPEPRRPSSAPETYSSQPRPKSRRSSWKVTEFSQNVPKPAQKEELYNMILTSQAQGRLEEQRSKAPGPMDDEDFFSLLLKVQGGRMEEQRTELPVALRY